MQQTPIKYGIITGAAMVLYLLFFYNMDKAQVLNPLVFWSALLFPMIGMVMATRKVKEVQGGEIDKKEAIKTSFLTWLIAMGILMAFIFVLFNFIDNSLIDLQKGQFEAATGKTIKREDLVMTFGSVFFRWAVMLLPGFLLAYAVASFLRSK
jgi:hypothetical protein